MKKRIIIVVIMFVTLATITATAISSNKQAKAEKNLGTAITSFLSRDFVWDESTQKLYYPEHIEITFVEDGNFLVMFPLDTDGYRLYYSTEFSNPDFFVESPESTKNVPKTLSSNLLSVCKRLQYGTCFLQTTDDTVLIQKIRIFRDGTLEAEDSSGKWLQKISCDNFILA